MKTKYIIHGGFAGHINSDNDKFFQEILKDTGERVNILLVYFAKELDRIPVNQAEDEVQFGRSKESKILTFEVARDEKFLEQVKWADVIYLHGGTTLKLLETLKKFSGLEKLFVGKTVAGESAGAYVLSAYFYSKSAGGLFQGLGLLPIKLICHYVGENSEKLKDAPDNLETLLLPDYKFRVYETA